MWDEEKEIMTTEEKAIENGVTFTVYLASKRFVNEWCC